MTFLAIDPGVNTGWALVSESGSLVACGKGATFAALDEVRAAVVERPQVYQARHMKGDPNDIVTLAIRVGRYQERLESMGIPTQLVLPTTWKGQVEKKTHHLRLCRVLSDTELRIVEAVARPAASKGYDDNVWDAVALGKWAFTSGRFLPSTKA